MSTPNRFKRKNVNAPFKSPLRPVNTNTNVETAEVPKEKDDTVKHYRNSDLIQPDKSTETDYDSEIKKQISELMEIRSGPIDIDEELKLWRSRMHAYNEAKDACLVLFGQLAHIKGCLIKELYMQYGLELDD